MNRYLVMIGTDLQSPGGMTAVAQAYLDEGLAQRWALRYLASFHHASLGNKLWCALRTLLQLLGLLLCGRVAGVHAHVAARGSFWRKGCYLTLARGFGVPTLLHLHDGSFPAWYEGRSPRGQGVVRWLLRGADRVVCLSEGWAEQLARIEPRARCAVLPNPVKLPTPAQWQARATQAGELLFLGRLWPEKGLPELLQAAAQLAREGQDFCLVCAGDGDHAAVRREAERLGLGARLVLPGWVVGERKQALLARAAVFVLPSHFEGVPIGMLEAMAWGVPVVATRVGGIPETLGEGAGWLLDKGDVAALTAALREALDRPEDAAARGAVGRERVQQRHAPAMVQRRLEALYMELGLVRRGARRAG
ncbi:glycosyltransferase family 4 protein [Paucibacter soli]|uniref:glycosyltransferase family 4 protein n=1 Tax=Paucibacter soli TaxID=3133433 RepID=UPI00309DC228